MSRVVVPSAFVLIAALAVAVWVLGYANPASSLTSRAPTFDRAVERALSDYRANLAVADTASRQQVVNGWVARDLLIVIASQQSASLRSQSDQEALLVLLILTVGLFGITTAIRRTPAARPVALSGEDEAD